MLMAHLITSLFLSRHIKTTETSRDTNRHSAMAVPRFLFLFLFQVRFSISEFTFIEEPRGHTENDFFHVLTAEGRSLVRAPPSASRGLFGHSVAIFRNDTIPAVLVGAPLRGSTGSVYSCALSGELICRNLSLEVPAGRARAPVPNRGFLGGSLAATSLGDRSFLLFCDHLFAFSTQKEQRPEPSGLCNLLDASGTNQALSFDPCERVATSDCLSGFSSVLRPSTKNSQLLVAIALPSLDQGHGQAAVASASPDLETNLAFSYTHRTFSNKDAYLNGFGLAFGHFSDAEALFVTDAGKRTKVEVFTDKTGEWTQVKTLEPRNIPGGVVGRFGFALCTTNFAPGAKERQSSLLVGDPFFSVPKANLTNAGAVFLFCRLNQESSTVILGSQSDGQFGFAIAEVGDVNSDKVPDFAVGCPYCDGGRGAVFVFAGRTDCNRQGGPWNPISVLRDEGVQGFGWSLAGGDDFDDNGSPDLVVGAALSDAVVVVKTRPSLYANCLRIGKDCRLFEEDMMQSGAVAAQCSVEFLCEIDFKTHIPLKGIELTVKVDFDVHKTHKKKRMAENGEAVVLKSHLLKYFEKRSTFKVKVEPRLTKQLFKADRDTPIDWEVRMLPINATSLASDQRHQSGTRRPPPVLRTSPFSYAPVITYRNCGKGNCITDLQVRVEADSGPIIFRAAAATVVLQVSIDSSLKDALRARARLEFRNGVSFGSSDAECHVVEKESTAVCDLNNIEKSRLLRLTLDFSAAWRLGWRPSTPPQLLVQVTSSNPDANQTNNRLEMNFTADYLPNITLSAHNESSITVIDSRESISSISGPFALLRRIGPRLHHVYRLSNGGISPALGVQVVLELPLWSAEDPLLYLLAEVKSERGMIATRPRVLSETGSHIGECQVPAGQINPRNLTVREDYEDLTKDILRAEADNKDRAKNIFHFRDRGAEHRRRTRRSVASESGGFRCPGPGCVQVRCRLPSLPVGAVARIVLDAWLWSPTMGRRQLTDVRVESRAWAWVGEAPAHLNLTESFGSETLSTTTSFIFSNLKGEEVDTVPLVVMAFFIGLILLIVMIFILYKCHFFERQRAGTVRAMRVSKIECD